MSELEALRHALERQMAIANEAVNDLEMAVETMRQRSIAVFQKVANQHYMPEHAWIAMVDRFVADMDEAKAELLAQTPPHP